MNSLTWGNRRTLLLCARFAFITLAMLAVLLSPALLLR